MTALTLPTLPTSTEAALALFDALEPVSLEEMLGRWRGEGFATGHPLDGLLETYNWYGKEFRSPNDVDPLLFADGHGGLFQVNPALMPMGLAQRSPLLKTQAMGRLFALMRPLLRTNRSRARLRLTDYRGKVSATMIYDQLPIHDVFRRLDANTVLGVMDLKGLERPFFFLLRRDGV